MKKLKKSILYLGVVFTTLIGLSAFGSVAGADVNIYRMYNGNSGEHFYTGNANERNSLINAGWSYEGVGWVAPDGGSEVHRVYNPNSEVYLSE